MGYDKFAEKLKSLREKQKLTQEDLATRLYVSRKTISKWETGRGLPSIYLLEDLSKILNTTLDYLIIDATSDNVTQLNVFSRNKVSYVVSVFILSIISILGLIASTIPAYLGVRNSCINLVTLFSFLFIIMGFLILSYSYNTLSIKKKSFGAYFILFNNTNKQVLSLSIMILLSYIAIIPVILFRGFTEIIATSSISLLAIVIFSIYFLYQNLKEVKRYVESK